MEAPKSNNLVDLGAGDATPCLKCAEYEHKTISPEVPCDEISLADDLEPELTTKATPISGGDSGFADITLPQSPIFLHLCGQCPSLPSFQYDCLKVLTWLRAANQHFQIFNHKLDMDGRFPSVEIGTEEITNNNGHILRELSHHLQYDLDGNLTDEQQILAFSLSSLIEHTLVREHREWCRTKRGELLQAYAIDLKKSWKKSLPSSILQFLFKRSASKSAAPNSSTATVTDLISVLAVLSKLLGDKKFFFSDEASVSSLDVSAFAILAPILFISEEVQYVARDQIRKNFTNLVGFVERMKRRLYPDWDQLCDDQKTFNDPIELNSLQKDVTDCTENKPKIAEETNLETAV